MRYRNRYTGRLFEAEVRQVADLPIFVLREVDTAIPFVTARCGHGLAEDFEPVDEEP
jgi:hypothetical protein